jgi:hypothetical protein
MSEIIRGNDYHPAQFQLEPGYLPPSNIEVEHQIDLIDQQVGKFGKLAGERIHHIFEYISKLRPGDPDEHLAIVADSQTDLSVIIVMAKVASQMGVVCDVIYYRTNRRDNGAVARILEILDTEDITVLYFDFLHPKNTSLDEAVSFFDRRKYTNAITCLSDSYDVRRGINDFASDNNISIVEMPDIDIASFQSEAFTESSVKMFQLGEEIITGLRDITQIEIVDQTDGTDLKFGINPSRLINEAGHDFSRRPKDYVDHPKLPKSVQDDVPFGEIWANVTLGSSEGTLVLYQIDREVLHWSARNGLLKSDQINNLIYDPNDPIKLEIVEGKIVKNGISGGRRARLLQAYLEAQAVEDQKAAKLGQNHRRSDAPYFLVELGIGINAGAPNPEEFRMGIRITNTLVTEKAFGVVHVAFGNSPDLEDDPENINISDTHIDNGLRNSNFEMWGIKKDGTRILLMSPDPSFPGELDIIFNNYK